MPTTLGSRIRVVRTTLGMSQMQLAQQLGAGRAATVSNWERNRATPERGTLRLLADLTNDPTATFIWLQFDGLEPEIAARTHSTPRIDSSPLPLLPLAPPPANADPEQVQRAYADFTQRVATLAAAGRLVPAHYLLEWAAMLFRTNELYLLATQRLRILMRELPMVVFELDHEGRVVGHHVGHNEDVIPDAMIGKPFAEVLPQIDQNEFRAALDRAHKGVVAETMVALQFRDRSRQYHARIWLLPDGHAMVFIERANENRKNELGLRKSSEK